MSAHCLRYQSVRLRLWPQAPRQASQQFLDRLSGIVVERVRDLYGTADGGVVLDGPIDSKSFVDGGEDIAHAGGATGYIGAVLIARSDDLSAFYASAAKHERPACRPMIAAQVRVYERCAAKLTHRKHNGGIEKTAFLQVIEKHG